MGRYEAGSAEYDVGVVVVVVAVVVVAVVVDAVVLVVVVEVVVVAVVVVAPAAYADAAPSAARRTPRTRSQTPRRIDPVCRSIRPFAEFVWRRRSWRSPSIDRERKRAASPPSPTVSSSTQSTVSLR
jgi:hypothetical protein